MDDLQPIIAAHLFAPLNEKLIQLLEGLSPEDWGRSALPQWSVKDVAAHLLDTNLRRLSIARDHFWGEPFRGNTADELNTFLNNLNQDWVGATRRLSPPVLIALLEKTGQELADYLSTLSPFQPAVFAVSWAGEETSHNWFDIAREYTEKWHHQQQIRDAVGQPGIMTRELYAPIVATFMRVLPFAYRNTTAETGTSIQFQVTGESGGDWVLVCGEKQWTLHSGRPARTACEVTIPGELAWKLFTKGLRNEAALSAIRILGDRKLGEPALTATAIVG